MLRISVPKSSVDGSSAITKQLPFPDSENIWNRYPEALEWRLRSIVSVKGRALVLLRNPYESLLSHFTHERTGGYDVNGNLSFVQPELDSPLFHAFVLREIPLWEQLVLDYLTVGSHVVVTHYELFKEDWEREGMKVMAAMELNIDPGRIECYKM